MSAAAASLRYVVLYHTGVPQPHYDLMIEASLGGELMTWRVDRWSSDAATQAIKLVDHRRSYLDYEGPVSGGRGEVKRVAGGQAIIEQQSSDELDVRLDGGSLLLLRRVAADRWSMRKIDPSHRAR